MAEEKLLFSILPTSRTGKFRDDSVEKKGAVLDSPSGWYMTVDALCFSEKLLSSELDLERLLVAPAAKGSQLLHFRPVTEHADANEKGAKPGPLSHFKTSIRFSKSSFMLRSLTYMNLSFVQDDRCGYFCIFLYADIQLEQHNFLKMLSFFPFCFWLDIYGK